MNIGDLINLITNLKGRYIIKLIGLVNFTIIINELGLLTENSKLWLTDKSKKILCIDTHQIMKIYINKENIIVIKLDQLLEINIIYLK